MTRLITAIALTALVTPALAQRGPGGMGQGRRDGAHMEDMRGIHALLDQRAHITRTVTVRPDGVETLTESTVPEVARLIQTHVAAMYARVDGDRPIHMRDPLFREVFAHARQIVMRHEATPAGVRVVETSTDPYVVRLIQAHAEVVSAFLANGRSEMMKDHPVPPRPQ
jgi:hypothetical protein